MLPRWPVRNAVADALNFVAALRASTSPAVSVARAQRVRYTRTETRSSNER